MIKYTDQATISSRIFTTPFENELSPNNRWVQLEKLIPWDKMAKVFFDRLNKNTGRSSIDLRIVMGSMFIQYSLNLTDRATMQSIQENIYMQYFLGLSSFQTEAVFDHSLLSIIRKRLGNEGASQLNNIFLAHSIEEQQIKHRKARSKSVSKEKGNSDDGDNGVEELEQGGTSEEPVNQTIKPNNRGTVKIDASVVPQNITYPTDTKLLNRSRELSEQIIDELFSHAPVEWKVKPRTYRLNARKTWLSFSKNRKSSGKKIRNQKKADLGYVRRNLKHIDEMMGLLLSKDVTIQLPEDLRKKLYVISEVYRQQKYMYDNKTKKVPNRIVSIAQPWVRPIVRGKAGSPVEFGAKVNISVTEKMVTVDQSSFDAFNESKYLIDQLKSYKSRFGYYPEYALVDQIYLTRNNRAYMKEQGIKHNGKPLGRPKKDGKKSTTYERKKHNERNHVEGKIGQGKLKYGLNKLRTKLESTSYCAIHLIALVMNMAALSKSAFWPKINLLSCVIEHVEIAFQHIMLTKVTYKQNYTYAKCS